MVRPPTVNRAQHKPRAQTDERANNSDHVACPGHATVSAVLGRGRAPRSRVAYVVHVVCSHAVTVQVHRVARATSGRQPPPLIMLRWVARTFLVPRSYRGTLAGIVVIAVLR